MKVIYSRYIAVLIVGLLSFTVSAQEEYEHTSEAERHVSPSYRITEKPKIVDTIIPTPNVQYPLLSRNMHTQITIDQIQPSKLRIVNKLDKLYPGYVKLGIGNYISPLGELYFNSTRHRRMMYGAHVKHNSSFGNIKGWAPSGFDNTSAKLFGEFHSNNLIFEAEGDYLNNGYHFYGIEDSLDLISKDSLKNRVQGLSAGLRLSNYEKNDSGKFMWTAKTNYMYFHEFRQPNDEFGRNARNHNYFFGGEVYYKMKNNIFKVDADVQVNRYWAAENDTTVPAIYRRDTNNTLLHLHPYATTYHNRWKFLYGAHIYFDFPSNETVQVVPSIEAKYSMFNNMMIPYVIIDGGVQQHSFYTLNRMNRFIAGSVDLKNTRTFSVKGGIKGTLSKHMSFNVAANYKRMTNMPMFINEDIFSDLYKFMVIYDNVDALGGNASLSYQDGERLKIDGVVSYYKFLANNVNGNNPGKFVYHIPEFTGTLRATYNMFDKIYVKADVGVEAIRKSPVYLYNEADDDIVVDLGTIVDGNLGVEYRYNKRISIFLQLNNIGAQKYYRWYNYRVQGFQVMGGATFSF